ncbi:hypothetical protein SODALDRAFT_74065 [Sodiomyces alkalinus F11]|uniref:Uncharacterized protein n=1 Tax=Sodiomyces alkalinus (strain CBS 110278 / VKM F-3762 / F11) TaxID=1314773 RepID=A0A3N2PK78_SODAK|nr:hypothetical protein SODALDRAFT_74065 [Sodiomyces alkalinus F11]ROT34931.1 hypothetical protein SODALDRAFT_74065 [Sodiomyces alkalinus F11]
MTHFTRTRVSKWLRHVHSVDAAPRQDPGGSGRKGPARNRPTTHSPPVPDLSTIGEVYGGSQPVSSTGTQGTGQTLKGMRPSENSELTWASGRPSFAVQPCPEHFDCCARAYYNGTHSMEDDRISCATTVFSNMSQLPKSYLLPRRPYSCSLAMLR